MKPKKTVIVVLNWICSLFQKKHKKRGGVGMGELIKALKRFDSLETVTAELEAYDREYTIDDLIEYLNDEADYAVY